VKPHHVYASLCKEHVLGGTLGAHEKAKSSIHIYASFVLHRTQTLGTIIKSRFYSMRRQIIAFFEDGFKSPTKSKRLGITYVVDQGSHARQDLDIVVFR
jgi:hypothetical protein